MLTVDVAKSRVLIETAASGLLARVAHDLRIEAPIEDGASPDGQACSVRFDVNKMRVAESSRHETGAWHPPARSDADDIEGRIRREVFEECPFVSVEGRLRGERATLVVQARSAQSVEVAIDVDRDASGARARGACELSLRALGTGKVRVPLGAIKLEDRVTVTFDIRFTTP
jgi:hypothetical protein